MDADRQPVAYLRLSGQACPEGLVCLLYPGRVFRLGRTAENDLVINDAKISRSHAYLEWNGSGFTLYDLNSINGTFVNGETLGEKGRLLRDGDEILLSTTKLVYEIVRAEPAPPLQPEGWGGDQAAQHRPCLVVVAGPDQGREFPLWGETITIGRDSREATWEIRLSDRAISRPHARLERRAEGDYLLDLDSANGTRLNGLPLQGPMPIKAGDVIDLGSSRLVLRA